MNRSISIAVALAAVGVTLAVLPTARAVSPPPDGNYNSGVTAEGNNALFSSAGGVWNTALGAETLYNTTTGNSNTAAGVRALFSNINGSNNVACGIYALYWQFTRAGALIQEMQQRAGVPNPTNPGILLLVPYYNVIVMQEELNKVWTAPG